MPFRVKICGVTNAADAVAAVEAGADAIGLNFYSGSRRCIRVADAQPIREAVGDRATCVGVFVNASAAEIHDICASVELQLVQLHGDEPPAFLAQLSSSFGIIRARRLDDRGISAIVDDIKACCELAGSGASTQFWSMPRQGANSGAQVTLLIGISSPIARSGGGSTR